MKWSKGAEELLAKVPFFVRGRVRKRVEEEAGRTGAREVSANHVLTCRKRFLQNMESEVKGYAVETCFGPSGCPNQAMDATGIVEKLDEILSRRNLREFLKTRVQGPLKMHHEFRITVADCPNACSRPQIVDIGLIGAARPRFVPEECTGCGACLAACREAAMIPAQTGDSPARIDTERCLACGQCIKACPSEALTTAASGFRILVGGKLGRHPQLGHELPGIFTPEETLRVVERCLDLYMEHSQAGERFGEILNRIGVDKIVEAL